MSILRFLGHGQRLLRTLFNHIHHACRCKQMLRVALHSKLVGLVISMRMRGILLIYSGQPETERHNRRIILFEFFI